jgi:hypothetical protein
MRFDGAEVSQNLRVNKFSYESDNENHELGTGFCAYENHVSS